jgi:hypothetical protein
VNPVQTALLLLLAATDAGAVQPGDHLFVRARIVDCGEGIRLVDHVSVSEGGEAVFANGIRLQVAGLTPAQIAALLAQEIGAATGRTPQTLQVETVPAADTHRVLENLRTMLVSPKCDPDSATPDVPLPPEGYNRRIASSPPPVHPLAVAGA